MAQNALPTLASSVDVSSLLTKLTLEEKISLLSAVDWWRTAVIRRDDVFVPHIKTTDGPNGARGESYVSGIKAACFPCGTCLGSTFDVDLLHDIGKAVAKEAKTKAANVLLGPTLNVIRSPLGGRNYETYSEDPLVLGLLSAAYVNGCQEEGIAATPKHFVANDAENERTTLSVEVDEQTLREIYLRPFQLIMKLADPWCFMSSYNRVNGIYVPDDGRLITQVLREEWGFKGTVLSDWMGTYSTSPGIKAGVDLEMPGPPKWRTLPEVLKAVKSGELSEETINTSVRRVLELAKRLGRFENPGEAPEYCAEDPARDAFIKNAAADGITLLKNEGLLPIPKSSSVAVIGQHATSVVLGGGGSARVDAVHTVPLTDGLTKLGYDIKVAAGVPVFGSVPQPNPSIIFKSGKSQTTKTPVRVEWYNGSVIGENPAFEEMRPNPEYMIKEQWPDNLSKEYCTRITFDLVAPSTGNHMLSVISTGRALCYINEELVFERPQETNLKLESFYFFKKQLERRFDFRMTAGQRYSVRLDSWACEPQILAGPPLFGKMHQGTAVRFHEEIDMPSLIEDASKTAATADCAIVCVGTINEIESEGFDRDTMDLSAAEYDMIRAAAAANPKTIVVNFSGAPVSMTQFVDTVPAVVQAWFPGQEMGDSVAAVLSGAVNPSGRLPLSWPRRNEDTPAFGNFPVKDGVLRYKEGLHVGYRYYDQPGTPEPLFPFGFGLSYTTFAVTDAKIDGSATLSGAEGSVTVTAEVQNTGSRAGKCAVQFYVHACDPNSGSLKKGVQPRPLKELQGFAKTMLESGEKKCVSVTLDKYSVSYYSAEDSHWVAPDGKYQVWVGLSSVDISTKLDFTVDRAFTWTGV